MEKTQCKGDASSRNKPLQNSDLSYGDLIVEIGRLFINIPYKEGTLECPGHEKLIVNLSAFDCTTFVETVIALTKCAASGNISQYELKKNLKLIRYRRGKIDGYASRLHYFTDWLRDNENKKIITDISRRLGGKPQRKKIDFMTAHRELYAALINEGERRQLSIMEKNLSRKTFYIIGEKSFGAIKTEFKNGDIIAFATRDEGLDIAHVGFALWQGRGLYLLHASKKEGGVVISQKTLLACLKQNKNYSGIIAARLL
ncbi:MAG TPA: N-acetylmuramoyl-L-alanine amidase-like domain-containing protein [Smithella sp.]|nr:N-acetylmuramoyl-L-alanine amidase-like domain-containing protein [Smithella sp.]